MLTTPGAIRRHYEHHRAPICSAARARRDVLALLEDRKAIARAGEALMMAALPYSGDPKLKKAIDDFRAAIEGRAPQA
jgi:hypothetical protein